MIRIIITLCLAACGLWLICQVGTYMSLISARHPDGVMSLVDDAPFLLRFVGALLLCLGAAAGLLGRRRLAKWLIGPGTLCYLLLTIAIIALGGDVSLWLDEAIWSGVLLVLTAALFRTR